MRDDPVLIGPPRVGKTTLAARLAAELDLVHHELDARRRAYYEEIGFDMDFNLALFDGQGWAAMYHYWKVFDPHAIERFFEECSGVLDVGGGTPIGEHPATFERIAAAFAPFQHVILLLPDADLERSLEILGTRTDDDPAQVLSQRHIVGQGSLQRLATHTVYTGERDADAVFAEVLALLGR